MEQVSATTIIEKSQKTSLAKLLYVITSTAIKDLESVNQYLPIHLEYLHSLETEGIYLVQDLYLAKMVNILPVMA